MIEQWIEQLSSNQRINGLIPSAAMQNFKLSLDKTPKRRLAAVQTTILTEKLVITNLFCVEDTNKIID